ncbi:helix-turn-helix transcriptional regulator [Devosia sp. RR2S18]|uniref:helix-turn-helix transcriptional regulator n=1 Tax=Devosia rhizosphaerae TaxID=3049774 RepID=UPI0025419E76|nr:hypothetical protein [Devosia sp. RR2S18]WIJ23935.1 hypothetical protein QOV41_12900 [Devosia sp. RR2S18]
MHKEFLAIRTASENVVGAVVHRSGPRQLVLEIRYEKNDPDARRVVRRTLEVLTPHIVRVVELVRERQATALEGQSGDALLEFIPVPAFALDACCVVRARNDHAESMIRHMDCLILGADGVLHARDANLDLQIKSFVSTGGGEFRRPARCVLTTLSSDGGRIFASMHTVPPSGTRPGLIHGMSQEEGWRCLLVLDDASKPIRMNADVLWKALGFTAGETDLVQGLIGGNTIGDCAAARRASKQSMRNLLLSVMRKTGTHRQTQLVSLLTRLALHARA